MLGKKKSETRRTRGNDVEYLVEIPFLTAARGRVEVRDHEPGPPGALLNCWSAADIAVS